LFVGTFSTVARLFGLACPFVADLAPLWRPLPMLTLGAPAAIAATLVAIVLPETSKVDLPQSMKEGFKLNNRKSRTNNNGSKQEAEI